MIVPIRCFSCGKPVAQNWEEYNKLLADGKSRKEVLDKLELVRFCCRSTIMSHVESIDIVGAYK